LLTLGQSIRLDSDTGGVSAGFSVFPTRNAQLLARAGLRSGDVLTHAGGVELRQESDLDRVLATLETERRISLRIVRNGRERGVTLRLSP